MVGRLVKEWQQYQASRQRWPGKGLPYAGGLTLLPFFLNHAYTLNAIYIALNRCTGSESPVSASSQLISLARVAL